MLVLPLARTHRPARVGGRRKGGRVGQKMPGLHPGFLWALALLWMSPQSTTEGTSSMRVSPFLRSSPHAVPRYLPKRRRAKKRIASDWVEFIALLGGTAAWPLAARALLVALVRLVPDSRIERAVREVQMEK